MQNYGRMKLINNIRQEAETIFDSKCFIVSICCGAWLKERSFRNRVEVLVSHDSWFRVFVRTLRRGYTFQKKFINLFA